MKKWPLIILSLSVLIGSANGAIDCTTAKTFNDCCADYKKISEKVTILEKCKAEHNLVCPNGKSTDAHCNVLSEFTNFYRIYHQLSNEYSGNLGRTIREIAGKYAGNQFNGEDDGNPYHVLFNKVRVKAGFLKYGLLNACDAKDKEENACKFIAETLFNQKPSILDDECYLILRDSAKMEHKLYCEYLHFNNIGSDKEKFKKWSDAVEKYANFSKDVSESDAPEDAVIEETVKFYLNRVGDLKDYEVSFYEQLIFDLQRPRAKLIELSCKEKTDCERIVTKLMNRKSPLVPQHQNLFKEKCEKKEKYSEMPCSIILEKCYINEELNCKQVFDLSFEENVCENDDQKCEAIYKEYCEKSIDVKCDVIFHQMGVEKLISLMPNCEKEIQTKLCERIVNNLQRNASEAIFSGTFSKYCTDDKLRGNVCQNIRKICEDSERSGCDVVMGVYHPLIKSIAFYGIFVCLAVLVVSLIALPITRNIYNKKYPTVSTKNAHNAMDKSDPEWLKNKLDFQD